MTTPETILNATIATETTEETDLILDVELADEPETTFTPQAHKRYCGKLRMLQNIHAEIAEIINGKREKTLDAFQGADDKYIPDNPKENFRELFSHAFRPMVAE